MAKAKKKKEKRSRASAGRKTVDEQFPGPHPKNCKCPTCTEERDEAERLKAEAEERKRGMAKEGRIRKLYRSFRRFRVGMVTFWEAMHDVMSAVLSFITVVALIGFLWIAFTRVYNGEWIVPLVCLAALLVIGYINERLG